jgi:hypothetical protein
VAILTHITWETKMIDVNEIRQKSVRAMLLLRTIGENDSPYSVEEQLDVINTLLHDIYTIATNEKSD